jgi:hypothetical protein
LITADNEQRIDVKPGRLAPVVRFLVDDAKTITPRAEAAAGEGRLAGHLRRVLGDRAVLLHDRRVPGSRANIDHLAVAPSGVWVIDAKDYNVKVERRNLGGWFKGDHRLYVGGHDRTRLVEGLGRQVDAVEKALGDPGVPVHAALCFSDATWGRFPRPFRIGSTWVTYVEGLAKLIAAPGDLEHGRVVRIARQLGAALPPAAPT